MTFLAILQSVFADALLVCPRGLSLLLLNGLGLFDFPAPETPCAGTKGHVEPH